MKKVWIIFDEITLHSVFTTKKATMAYIEKEWPDVKLIDNSPTMLHYESENAFCVLAYFRYVNIPFKPT